MLITNLPWVWGVAGLHGWLNKLKKPSKLYMLRQKTWRKLDYYLRQKAQYESGTGNPNWIITHDSVWVISAWVNLDVKNIPWVFWKSEMVTAFLFCVIEMIFCVVSYCFWPSSSPALQHWKSAEGRVKHNKVHLSHSNSEAIDTNYCYYCCAG